MLARVALIRVPKKKKIINSNEHILLQAFCHDCTIFFCVCVPGTMLDTEAMEVSKIRCLPSKSAHDLVGDKQTVTVYCHISMPEVATRTNSLRAERVTGKVQAPDCISSAS